MALTTLTATSNPALGHEHWSPATRDLAAELPVLMKRLHGDGFDVWRVMFNLSDWDDTPRRSKIGNRTVKFGGFTTQRHDVITVIDLSGQNRVDVTTDHPR